ncbi:hypothetical protein Btru_011399 [Bulinus truncatus]|nr:hypothetical protein Btru_011399 [Bulinus truncatus]
MENSKTNYHRNVGQLHLTVNCTTWGGLTFLLAPHASAHDCEIEQGREVNVDDDSCESYWSCKDYEGTLSHCDGDTQFDFAWRECRPNREVWCQWQVQTVQRKGGLEGTPFDMSPRKKYNVKKSWLREMVQGGRYRPILTYNGERPAKSYTHTHDGSTHMHLLDAKGQYIDTTDHFHESRGSPSIVRERREAKVEDVHAGSDKKILAASESSMKSPGAKKFHKKLGAEDKQFQRRSHELGIYYDVTLIKSDKDGGEKGGSVTSNGDDVDKKDTPEINGGDYPDGGKDKNTENTADEYEYYDYEDADIVCHGGFGREPDLQDMECKLFWECTKQSVSYLECDDGYLYDIEKKDCVYHTKVNCQEQLHKALQARPEYPTVEARKGNDMTVVHHYYHGGAKPSQGHKLPDEIYKVDDNDMDSPGDRSTLAKMRDHTLVGNKVDLANYSEEDSIIKRIRKSSPSSGRHSEPSDALHTLLASSDR